MKKLLLTLTLGAAVVSAYGQGSVGFSNPAANRLSTQVAGSAASSASTNGGMLEFGMFWGVGATQPASLTLLQTQLGVNSTTGAGLIASPLDGKTGLSNVALPATTAPGETDIWLQIRGWSASFGTDWAAAKTAFAAPVPGTAYGESAIVNINALGNPAVSGVPIWQAASGTNPKLINAFVIPIAAIPEPTTMALAGLGLASLLIFRRRS